MTKKKDKKNHQGEGGGRPPLYKTDEELQQKIKEYFEDGMTKRKVLVGKKPNQQIVEMPMPTITGLVLYLGYSDRHSFYDLEKHVKFSHTIKKARTFIEKEYEELLQLGNTTAIFALKNFGWTDKTEVHNTGDMRQTIVVQNKDDKKALEENYED